MTAKIWTADGAGLARGRDAFFCVLLCVSVLCLVEDVFLMASNVRAGLASAERSFYNPLFDELKDFYFGLAAYRMSDKWGYMDEDGRLVTDPVYQEAGNFTSDLLASVRMNYKCGFIDRTGRFVVDPIYEETGDFVDGVVNVRYDDKWGVVDKAGRFVVSPSYQKVVGFSEGLAAFNQNGKWGFMDKTGAVAIGPIYDEAERFSKGFARVRLNDKWGYIDATGRIVLDFLFDEAGDFRFMYNTRDYASVVIRGKNALVDRNGRVFFQGE